MYSVRICTLLKVVSYYDLNVLSMHVSDGFPKKVWMGVGWVVFAKPFSHAKSV